VRSYLYLACSVSSLQGLSSTSHASALIDAGTEAWRIPIARRSYLCKGKRWPRPTNMAPD
jgi:hypothetical protein